MSDGKVLEMFGVVAGKLDSRAAQYESDDWADMGFGPISPAGPPSYGKPLATITVCVPRSRIAATKEAGAKSGISRSDFIRRAIDHELAEVL